MQVHSLGAACAAAGTELVVFVPPDDRSVAQAGTPAARAVPVDFDRPQPHMISRVIRRATRTQARSAIVRAIDDNDVPVALLTVTFAAEARHLAAVGWIPDFQHVHLPEYFSPDELRNRDASFRLLAKHASIVLLSSENARDHFVEFEPEHAHKARVASFPSLLAFEELPRPAAPARERFHLPEKFALVVNQFWRHKNHGVVLDALAQLKRDGTRVPTVMAGLPVDYRDPLNRAVTDALQTIAAAELNEEVTILGHVDDGDLYDLMRAAAVVVQPSRFEGWSTVVQDCKALGRPVVCSDIPVHREQAPQALDFFPCDEPAVLANILARRWAALEPGPDLEAEQRSLAVERDFARKHGERLLAVCTEAYAGGSRPVEAEEPRP
jgi:glycosyltransferase involved in cell wall biosynthesis